MGYEYDLIKKFADVNKLFLDVVVAGAEKLPVELCDAFEKKFGVRPVEGYGATEMSPLAAANVPDREENGGVHVGEHAAGTDIDAAQRDRFADHKPFRLHILPGFHQNRGPGSRSCNPIRHRPDRSLRIDDDEFIG